MSRRTIVGCSGSDKTNETRSKDGESQLVVFEDIAGQLGVDFMHDDDGAKEHLFPAIMGTVVLIDS